MLEWEGWERDRCARERVKWKRREERFRSVKREIRPGSGQGRVGRDDVAAWERKD